MRQAGHVDGTAITVTVLPDSGATISSKTLSERSCEVPSADAWRSKLARTIEGEIIPRLMLAHKSGAVPGTRVAARVGDGEIKAFVGFLRQQELVVVQQRVQGMMADGQSLESICLDLLAPAARELGRMWEDDDCSFAEVTIALCRLQHIVHELGHLCEQSAPPRTGGRRALMSVTFGEQHTLGVVMVAELFRQGGWDVAEDLVGSTHELLRAVRSDWYDMFGISVGNEARLPAVQAVVSAVRRSSLNRDILIFVGGRVLAEDPARATDLGADMVVLDANEALVQANALFASRTGLGQAA